jgi:DMSO/TMAO reductase YedYZ molybdopterin-dependent catalytic subunit
VTDVARDRGSTVAGQGLPPGQVVDGTWPVMHYGTVPGFQPDSWDLRIVGATVDGGTTAWSYDDLLGLPQTTVTADFHCVTKRSVLGLRWSGVAASELLALAPPAPEARHVLVWADRGYSANLRLDDLRQAVFVHSVDGEPLRPERGWPLRLVVPHLYGWKGPKWVRGLEYLVEDRRGFWEERGYHNVGDPWLEQRYSYQEQPGEGPPLPHPPRG